MHKLNFHAPKFAESYIDQVKDRSLQLITSGIWSGIEISTLRTWLNNFNTSDEKYFAACVLDSLMYRSSSQTDALLEQLFTRCIPEYFLMHPTPININDDILKLMRKENNESDPGIRFVAVLKEGDPPTKSATFIARLIKRKFDVDEKWIVVARDIHKLINNGIKIFIFIDDFLGTGDQFKSVFKQQCLDKYVDDNYFLYSPLVAHEKGIRNLKKEFKNIHITCAEILNKRHSIFDKSSDCFKDNENTVKSARIFYYHLLKARGLTVKNRNGWGHLGLAYAFSHAVPDNCLPIFYVENRIWQPLFKR